MFQNPHQQDSAKWYSTEALKGAAYGLTLSSLAVLALRNFKGDETHIELAKKHPFAMMATGTVVGASIRPTLQWGKRHLPIQNPEIRKFVAYLGTALIAFAETLPLIRQGKKLSRRKAVKDVRTDELGIGVADSLDLLGEG